MQVARILQAYLDGETEEVTARRVAAHLKDCRPCGPEVETYRKIKEALTRRSEPDADSVERLRDFAEGLLPGGDGDEGHAQQGLAPLP
ncbi:anti-sigma factor family protein [Streptomyces tailanensis]|uniref:anti-sigma factor family protein n=1 Tax=Streptomyces tailanensis TaxID=2569858 RepID=UPI001FECAE0B|nr:anti-sigma factor [Streptomyces tailanensis]